MTLKVVSGGQTGVDRAALDAALRVGIPCGGWCPRGRQAEDGPIAARYPLVETPEARPDQRTGWNVRDSDATLVLARGRIAGGTERTVERARGLGRPLRVVDLSAGPAVAAVRTWIGARRIGVLNVAGPRESEEPGIHGEALDFLSALLVPPGGDSPRGTTPIGDAESGPASR
jgi:hypothetical protein